MDSTSRTNPTIELYSLSASPRVALNAACASIRPWISSIVWTINMSTRSSLVPSNQLLNGWKPRNVRRYARITKKSWQFCKYNQVLTAARLANSKCKTSIFSRIFSASSRAWRLRWVSVPKRSHWSQMRWHLALTDALSWYSRVL